MDKVIINNDVFGVVWAIGWLFTIGFFAPFILARSGGTHHLAILHGQEIHQRASTGGKTIR